MFKNKKIKNDQENIFEESMNKNQFILTMKMDELIEYGTNLVEKLNDDGKNKYHDLLNSYYGEPTFVNEDKFRLFILHIKEELDKM